jgi:hypothetical protein
MPGFLLHAGASVQCAHGGIAQPVDVEPRVIIDGQPVVTQPTVYLIAGCTLPPNAGGPCVAAEWLSAATRVFADGLPVLLQDSRSICAPPGTPLKVSETQVRVKGT